MKLDKRKLSLAVVVVLAVLAFTATLSNANTKESSTMWFQGQLTSMGGGIYSGVLPMIDEGATGLGDSISGYDIYAKDGATAWFGDDPGTGPVWTPLVISNHDGWPTWDPDTPDWYQYSLELYQDVTGQYRWAVRNHPGATQEQPWYDPDNPEPPAGVPMSGTMDWTNMIATEEDIGAYLPGTGLPEISGGAVGKGNCDGAWDMDWSWGSELVPLECVVFKVNIVDIGNGIYRVSLTPPSNTWYWKDYNGEEPGGYMPDIDQNQDFSVGRNLRFDFNAASSPTMPGWTGVLPTKAYTGPAPDHGWDQLLVNSVDRGEAFNALERDLHYYSQDRTFIVDLPENIYTVTVYIGDRGTYAHDNMNVTVEGKVIGPITTAAKEVQKHTVTVPVSDGKLNILFHDGGGTDPNWVVIGVEIADANYCAPVAEANSLWWLDKKWDHIKIFDNPIDGLGYFGGTDINGDGASDILDLVQDLAWFKDTNGQRTYNTHTGTTVEDERLGIATWLEEHGLYNKLYEHTWEWFEVESGPSMYCHTIPGVSEPQDCKSDPMDFFEYLESEVELCQDVKLDLGFWRIEECSGIPGNGTIVWRRVGGHAVTVAGVDSENFLFAISDPDNDRAEAGLNPGFVRTPLGATHPYPHDPALHNDENYASHDIYTVGLSPSPGGGLGLVGFPGKVNLPEGEQVGPLPTPWPPDFQCPSFPEIVTEIEAAVIVSPILGVCGNGLVEVGVGEECDDGNTNDGDGCSETCLSEVCGNSRIDFGEECDDGNNISDDGCSDTCQDEYCGDGIIQSGLGETCDPPGQPGSNPQQSGICRQSCTYCGDDIVNNSEQCDDANGKDDDSCKNDCTIGIICSFPFHNTKLSRGSTLMFRFELQNNTGTSRTFFFATDVTLPNANRYPPSGWLLGPTKFSLGPGGSTSQLQKHFIPYGAPFGTYTYHGYVGNPGPVIYHECQFNFEVIP